ncbi:MAG: STAS domain-containing protein [bacterium]
MTEPWSPEVTEVSAHGFESWVDSGAGADLLRVRGEIDLETGEQFAVHLREALRPDRALIIDLRDVSYIDVRGVMALEEAGVRAAAAGQRFIVVSSNALLHKLFSILQFDGGADLVMTVEDAWRLLGTASET